MRMLRYFLTFWAIALGAAIDAPVAHEASSVSASQGCAPLEVRNPDGNYIVPGVKGDIRYSGDLALDAYIQPGAPRLGPGDPWRRLDGGKPHRACRSASRAADTGRLQLVLARLPARRSRTGGRLDRRCPCRAFLHSLSRRSPGDRFFAADSARRGFRCAPGRVDRG